MLPKSVRSSLEPSGSALALLAADLTLVTTPGMLKTAQCHHPEPVGASGSKAKMAKLFVSFGASAHVSYGDIF